MKFLRITTSTIILTLFSLQAFAQSEFDFAGKQLKVWQLAKQRTIAVAQAMPETDYSYQPTPQVKSFGQQLVHIANSMLSMNTRFILKQRYNGREKNASTLTKAQIISELSTAFNEVINTLQDMEDEELQEIGKSHGAFPLTKWQSFLFMSDHITNHRAKTVLYLRLKGINPPAYGFN